MTSGQYYSEQKQQDRFSSVHIDDPVQPDWFEKIMKQLESDRNKPKKSNYHKI